ncbi:MAG: photosystem II complex extrinsic protein PsbU [Leptolyngbya sp. SIO1D8]|nr:photosystem II complex extrinsic protein PsbU [Leptolyngbya sp. SIO1D8]
MNKFLGLLTGLLVGLLLCLVLWFGLGFNQSAIAQTLRHKNLDGTYTLSELLRNPIDEKLGEVSSKIDLNNSNVMAFQRYRGMYPTLARKIIENAPFNTIEDVLNIPGLSEPELDLLKANLDNFVVTPPEPALIEGGDRINPGIYK